MEDFPPWAFIRTSLKILRGRIKLLQTITSPTSIFVGLLCCLSAWIHPAYGQQDGQESEVSRLQLQGEDSVNFSIHAFHPARPWDTSGVRDTQLIYPHTHHDPLRRDPLPYRWLGNIGDPAKVLYWEPDERIQFKTGVHPFEAQAFRADELLFYRLNASYTHAFFSIGPNQQNSLLEIKFARDFSPRINMTLHYRRINQDGIYAQQRNLHTSINHGWRYQSKDSSWSTVFQFTSNVFRSKENGGIPSDTIFEQELSDNRMTLPVRSREAETRQQRFHFQWSNYYRPNNSHSHSVQHQTIYRPEYYRSYDPAPDSSYYGPLFTDGRGLRMYLRDRMLANQLSWTFSPRLGTLKSTWNIGLRHEFHWIATDIRSTRRSDLGGFASLDVRTGQWRVRALVEGWTLDAKGAYKMDIDLSYEPFRWLNLRFSGLTQSTLIPYIFRNMDDPTGNQWTNPWNSSVQSNLHSSLEIRPLGLEISLGANRVDEQVYFDTKALPQRVEDPINWQYAMLRHQIRIGLFKTRTLLLWQNQLEDTEVLLLPNWYGEHRVSIKSPVFDDRLMIETGIDIRWMMDDPLPEYLPLTGQFHLPEGEVFEGSWTGDFFLAFRVKRFTGFLRLENLKDALLDERTYWAAHYPQLDFGWRLGLRWGFLQ